MKYARIERERRFLLPRVPPDVDFSGPYNEIHDRYRIGTRLRLREVRPSDGSAPVFKLTQKLADPDAEADPARRATTTTYLDAHEHELLSVHPAITLVKTPR